ncbi:type II toxin-antitoxin system RelE/ParE family toxin [Rhizobium sp. SGZ-381]|uniref:type II toxin-antitoxin system RelE/ParE family toxin n=1 Tax=Rhizobium sp. SGZ-381 TaxID=3342800 RepID=UPI00366DCE6C
MAAYAGRHVAHLKIDEIIGFIGKLADFPKIGSIRNDVLEGMRAVPASAKAVVCFTVDDTTMTVTVLCISYAGRDWAARIEKRR